MVLSGILHVVGVGPGPDRWVTLETDAILRQVDDLVGYGPYLDRLDTSAVPGQRHASDNCMEIDRARQALDLAASGRRVAVVSGGDPGIFAMAAAVFEAVHSGPLEWRRLDIRVYPGVTAMVAAAARLGAPLGHDFCAISLSINLKPWLIIERRLVAAATADFVVALYNPVSKARPHDLDRALDVLRQHRSQDTPIVFAAAIGRPDETVAMTTLGKARAHMADMRTLVLIGSSRTRITERPGNRPPFVWTPRTYTSDPI